ncbi:hypothetical protein [Streptacidiphilus sp. PB12-B1b]|uniref:hypothetical protein n=1 Tax=Streptacidiphilus sp. PB12-B1b TaxID=2705012 RepID=UPI0015FAEF62|nr:hypothetical protein [Streptacidiphilus sp. PB12-B1b]
MFLRPINVPTANDLYQPAANLPAPQPPATTAPACNCQHHTTPAPYAPTAPFYAPAPAPVPTPRPSLAPYIAGGIGAVTAVAVVGVIAIGLLLAFAASALALAVLRSLLNPSPTDRTRRR